MQSRPRRPSNVDPTKGMPEDMDKLKESTDMLEKLISIFPEPRRSLVKKMMEGQVGTSYMLSPASSREEYHSCYPGGLLAHSLNVVKNLKKIASAMAPGVYDDATLAFVGLFHDLGKTGDGVHDYYVPNQSEWGRKKGFLYETNKSCVFMPTSERSLFILQKYSIELKSEEYLAIRLNDGMYDETNRRYAMKEPELALLVHMADRFSCEREKNDKKMF